MSVLAIIGFVQAFFAIVIGLYFWTLLRNQRTSRSAVERESKKELEKLRQLRTISLTEPLAEKTRPTTFSEIIGQSEGLKSLRAALCGPNPQHVIIYGPPGVGKTAAARLVLEEAKRNSDSPFLEDAKFTEVDATTARFDERGIADPLIGSVHDPIYQGAGAMGVAGIPQPKYGAVTKAHGGVLFIDEIGELHPIQINKLLKVLEDRKVFLESAYYSTENTNIPTHVHDIFQNGLPADFRMVGATTRTADEIPPAIRSRCLEIFFRALLPNEIALIAKNAVDKIEFQIDERGIDVVSQYATNGREAVNIIQISAGIAIGEGRQHIKASDIEWVVHNSQISPRQEKKIHKHPQVGFINGLAVYGPNMGTILEVEVSAIPTQGRKGEVTITGLIEEETIGGGRRTVKRKSMAKGSVENVLTVLRKYMQVDTNQHDIHINFPGGIPIDGPSAGITIATGIYSAIKGLPISNTIAMTGEISIHGYVKPVGGVISKVEAAKQAGVKKVFIPRENWQEIFSEMIGIEVIAVERLEEVLKYVFDEQVERSILVPTGEILSASTI